MCCNKLFFSSSDFNSSYSMFYVFFCVCLSKIVFVFDILWIKIIHFLDNVSSFYVLLLLGPLVFCIVAAVVVFLCWRFYRRRRAKGSLDSLRNVNNNRVLPHMKMLDHRTDIVYSGDTRKITNREMQEQQRRTLSDMNRLSGDPCSYSKVPSSDLAVTVSEATQKLVVTIGGKTIGPDGNLLNDGPELIRSGRSAQGFRAKQFLENESQGRRSRQFENFGSDSSHGESKRSHLAPSCFHPRCSRPDFTDESESCGDARSPLLSSQLQSNFSLNNDLPEDSCECKELYNRPIDIHSDDCSECEEVAMIMNPTEDRRLPSICDPAPSCSSSSRCRHESPESHRAGPNSHPSVVPSPNPDRYYRKSDSGPGRRLLTSSHRLNLTPSDDTSLPSYESVVSSAPIFTDSNSAFLNHPRNSSTSDTTEQTFHYPPPSYSRHCDRTSKQFGVGSRTERSGLASSGHNHAITPVHSPHSCDNREDIRCDNEGWGLTFENNDDRASSPRPESTRTTGFLTGQFTRPLEAAV